MLNGLSVVVRGSSHEAIDLECQDFAELYIENENYALAAVADGHGSKKHYRSAKGSEFAALAAKESVYEYMKDYEKFTEAYRDGKKFLIDRIIKMTITKWHEKIQEHLNEYPVKQDEIDKYLGGTFNENRVSSIYGTTLLVGVMSEKCNFGFLIGDGSFVVIDKYGKAFIPIEDENSKANYTSSLSSSDSYNGFMTHFFKEMPFAIMVSTDGLVKSFGNENAFLDYNQAIAMEIGKIESDEDKSNMETRLIQLFDKRSREGSEDDISISIIYNKDGFDTVLNGLKTRRSINKLQEKIAGHNKEIVRLDFIEKQIKNEKRDNLEKIIKIQDQRSQLEKEKKDFNEKMDKLNKQIEKIERDKHILASQISDNEKRCSELGDEIIERKNFDNQKDEELKDNQEMKSYHNESIKNAEKEKEDLENSLK